MNIEAAPYRIDRVGQQLWRGELADGSRIDLPPKSFEMLRYLAENAGRLVSHTELLDTLWGANFVQPEVLKAHIRAIRNALGDSAETPRYIETVRGRGYRFIGEIGFDQPYEASNGEQSHVNGFVGREEPLAVLAAALRHASGGISQIVFITGEPGIGKTTLIDRFIGEQPGTVVAFGRCIEGFAGVEPYYPVLDALAALCRGPIESAVRRALVETAPNWAVQLPAYIPAAIRAALQQQIVGTGPERMVREVCALFELIAAERPIILVLEDLHWADYSTVDFISALVRRRSRSRLMLVATYRQADIGAAQHPVRQVVQDLLLHGLCTEIQLLPLSSAAVAQFLAGGVAPAAPTGFVDLVAGQSGGNPLFMQALLSHFEERQLVRRTGAQWTPLVPLGDIGFDVPPTIGQLIETRVRHLSVDERRVLETASVAGLEFCAGPSADAAGKSEAEFEELCDELARRECFVQRLKTAIPWAGGDWQWYCFNHSLYQQFFYRRQSEARRRQIHLIIGERLETLAARSADDELGMALAHHFIAARDWVHVLPYLQSALDAAKHRVAYRDALVILDQILALATNLPDVERQKVEIDCLEQRALIYGALYDPHLYEAYETLIERAAAYADVDIRVRILINAAHVTSWISQARCLDLLDQALQISATQTDRDIRAAAGVAVHAQRLLVAGWNAADAKHCAENALVLRDSQNRVAAAHAMIDHGIVGMVSTRYTEAIEAIRENIKFLYGHRWDLTQPGLARALWMNVVGVPICLGLTGKFGAGLDALDAGYEQCTKNGNVPLAMACRTYRGCLLYHAMDFSGVLETAESILAFFPPRAPGSRLGKAILRPVEERIALVLRAVAEVGLGKMEAARQHLAEAETFLAQCPVVLDWYWQMLLARGWVDLELAEGNAEAAVRRAQHFIACTEATDERTWQGFAWETRARVALNFGDAESAVAYVATALSRTRGFETPLADWRIQETAARIRHWLRQPERAVTHARAAAEILAALADSLPRGHRLRAGFENRMAFNAPAERAFAGQIPDASIASR